ncbi:multidrug resistance efflux pump [Mizugakiibacter sediminis]|uniref:Multidrug resistance efflux pump n=1 Tax=Mizugakiibacter sediminis TaxID=1475481 RepID=A0A0K8QKS2_9GAMM|nr:HlyD family efflux transporter periplasmic adaptor subunit [Mizugakiibacter sediminis]GAP65458.1 multidrug resistance efflux pump [Mizugakiibacter sediminis]
MNAALDPAPTNGNGKRKRVLLGIAAVFALAGLLWLLLWLLVFSRREVTDDAYVGGNQVAISAQVPGTVIAVLADDTQWVRAGQTLVKLDPTDAAVALAKAKSALAQAVRQVRQQRELAAQYDAAVAAREQELRRAEADLARRQPLLGEQAVAPEEVAHAREAAATARAQLDLARRQAAAAHALVDGTDVAGNPAVQQARAAFREAWIDAQRNAVLAPVDGYVAQRSAQVGQRVQPGQPLMTVIPLHALWVDANFKEVQLEHIRIGQTAEVRTDLYGGDVVFRGHVVGLGAGTGSAFALLPPQNASGNWIKVVQRVPVRIALDERQLQAHPLRIGLSATVTVDTRDRSGAVLARQPAAAPVAETDVYARDLADAEREADAVIRANLGADAR